MQQHSKIDTLYFTFGRFQPCTIAHEDMFNTIRRLAESNNAHYRICISSTQDPAKNIFTWEERVKLLTEAMPYIQINLLKDTRIDNIIKDFVSNGYVNLVFVLGKDRFNDFQWIYKYKEDLGYSKFSLLEYGNRNDNVISATNARLAAKEGNYNEFRKLISRSFTESQAVNMYHTIKERLL